MKYVTRRALLVMATLFSMITSPCIAQATIKHDWIRALVEVGSLVKKIEDAHGTANQIVDEEIKNVEGQEPFDWDSLATSYDTAARNIAKSPIETGFNSELFHVSFDELNKCESRISALGRLSDFSTALSNETTQLTDKLEQIDQMLERLGLAMQLTRELQTIYSDLVTFPAYGNLFVGDFFALESRVRPSIAKLRDALNVHRDLITDEIDLIDTQRTNLDSNRSLVEGTNCYISGTWKGICVFDDDSINYNVSISGSSGSFTSIFEGDRITPSLREIIVQPSGNIQMTVFDENETGLIIAMFSSDFLRMDLKSFDGEALPECALSRAQ